MASTPPTSPQTYYWGQPGFGATNAPTFRASDLTWRNDLGFQNESGNQIGGLTGWQSAVGDPYGGQGKNWFLGGTQDAPTLSIKGDGKYRGMQYTYSRQGDNWVPGQGTPIAMGSPTLGPDFWGPMMLMAPAVGGVVGAGAGAGAEAGAAGAGAAEGGAGAAYGAGAAEPVSSLTLGSGGSSGGLPWGQILRAAPLALSAMQSGPSDPGSTPQTPTNPTAGAMPVRNPSMAGGGMGAMLRPSAPSPLSNFGQQGSAASYYRSLGPMLNSRTAGVTNDSAPPPMSVPAARPVASTGGMPGDSAMPPMASQPGSADGRVPPVGALPPGTLTPPPTSIGDLLKQQRGVAAPPANPMTVPSPRPVNRAPATY